jgi:hypothetical protein
MMVRKCPPFLLVGCVHSVVFRLSVFQADLFLANLLTYLLGADAATNTSSIGKDEVASAPAISSPSPSFHPFIEAGHTIHWASDYNRCVLFTTMV